MSRNETILAKGRPLLPAFGCALLLALAVALVHPAGEIPMGDEITYVHTARVVARTGHVTYTGFISAMGGWQFYWGAAVVRLIGPSYLALRWSMALLGCVTAFGLHRCLAHAGVRPVPATVGTLTFCLSPLFLSKATTFLTDVPGVLAVVVCLYACLRALEADGARAATLWIGIATLGSSLLGSSRQYSWLAGLVMVPCALWLLRRQRVTVLGGAALWLVGLGMDCAMQAWFLRQPYIDSEPTLSLGITPHRLEIMAVQGVGTLLEIGLLLLPMTLSLLPGLWRRRPPVASYIACGLSALGALVLWRVHALAVLKMPYLGASFRWPIGQAENAVLTVLSGVGLLALVTAAATRKDGEPEQPPQGKPPISGRSLLFLLLPFTVLYGAALLPRTYNPGLWDRYLLVPAAMLLLVALRALQGRIRPQVALALAIGGGIYAAALLHDDFAYERARLGALNQLAARGVPRPQVTGGWAYDIETELQIRPFVTPDGVRLPEGVTLPRSTHYGVENCQGFQCDMVSDVVPRYAATTEAARALPGFAAVPYRGWVTASGAFYVTPFP